MNPIRWWLSWGVHLFFWMRSRKANPKPMMEQRDANGHLKRRKENAKWVEA